MKNFYLIIVILFISGCVSKQRESELLEEIATLEYKLDECENGAEKIHRRITKLFEAGEYKTCKSLYFEMGERHIDSKLYPEVKEIYEKIIQIEEKAKIEAKKKVEQERAAKLAALKKLRKKYDDVEGITWYRQPYFTHYTNTNLVSIYLGDNGSYQWLRLKMSYKGDNWIFFKEALLSYEGNTFVIPFDDYREKKSENDGGYVWEWIDVSVSDELLKYLRSFSQSKNAKMRLTGKYAKTRNLTWNERQGIRDVINGYDALTEKEILNSEIDNDFYK